MSNFSSTHPIWTGSYDVNLILAAGLVAILCSYLALLLILTRTDSGRERECLHLRLLGAAVAMGAGVWCMHFVAMSAYRLPLTLRVQPDRMALSWAAAVVAFWVALSVVQRAPSRWVAIGIGGAAMGAGIGAMHYLGMWAIVGAVTVQHRSKWVGLSVIVAVALSGVLIACVRFLCRRDHAPWSWPTMATAAWLGAGVTVIHVAAMGAADFRYDQTSPAPSLSLELAPSFAAGLVVCAVLLVAAATVAVLRRNESLEWLRGGLFFLVAGIGAINLAGLAYLEEALLTQVGEQTTLEASEIAANIDRLLVERVGDIQVLAKHVEPIVGDRAAMQQYLERVNDAYAVYKLIAVTDRQGRVVAATDPNAVGQDLSGESWYRAMRSEEALLHGEVSQFPLLKGMHAIGFQAVLHDRKHEFAGMVLTRVAIRTIEASATSSLKLLKQEGVVRGTMQYDLMTPEGQVFAGSMVAGETGSETNALSLGIPGAILARQQAYGFVEQTLPVDGMAVMTGYARMPANPQLTSFRWTVFVHRDRADVLAVVRDLAWKFSAPWLAVLVPTMGFIYWSVERLTIERRQALAHQAAAEEHQRRVQQMIDSALDGIISMDEMGRVTSWNPQASAMFGWSVEEAVGRNLAGLIVPERFRAAHHSGLERFLRTGEGPVLRQRLELVGLRREGGEFPIELSIFHDTQAGHPMFHAFISDISKRKHAERRLAVQHAASRVLASGGLLSDMAASLLESIGTASGWAFGALWVVQEETGTLHCVEAWSDKQNTMLGLFERTTRSRQLHCGEGLPGRAWEQHRPVWIADVVQADNYPRANEARQAGLHAAYAFPISGRSRCLGVIEWYHREAQSEDTEMMAMVGGLSVQIGQYMERLYAEAAMQAATRRLQAVLDAATHMSIIVTRPDGIITAFNSGAERLLGYRAEDVVGTATPEVFHDEGEVRTYAAELTEQLGRPISGFEALTAKALVDEVDEREWTYLRQDGACLTVSLTVTALSDQEGNVIGFLSIGRDITSSKQVEAERTKLLTVLEACLNEIYLFRVDTLKFTYVNRGACDNLGYPLAALLTLTPLNLTPEMTEASFRKLVAPLLTGERSLAQFQTIHRRADGSVYPVDVHLQVVHDGQEWIFLALVHDITERREIEDALKDSQQRLALALEGSNLGLWDWQMQSGAFTVDERWAAMLGYSISEVEPHVRTREQLIHPDDRAGVWEAWKAHVEGRTDRYECSHRFRDKSGAWRWMLDCGQIVSRDAEGRPLRAIGTHRDITETKRAEERFRQVVEASKHGMLVVDYQGRIQLANSRIEQMFGYERQTLLGQSVNQLVPDAFRSAHTAHMEGFSQSPDERWMGGLREVNGQTRTGKLLPVEVGLSSITTPEGLMVLCSVLDITDRRRAQDALEQASRNLAQKNTELAEARDRALEATRAKSEFLSTMSHEIRTPMNGVLGVADLLLDEDLSGKQRAYAETIKRSGEALMLLINDLLDYSKIEAGRLTLEAVDFFLPSVLDDAAMLFGDVAHRKGIELITHIDPTVRLALRGDPGRLRQVMLNLIGNAVKFTAHGSVRMSVHSVQESPSGVELRIEVRDTGIGIGSETVAQLFYPFVQADSSMSRKFGGTGLGLAICKRLVELMGGTIGVTSVEGEGSCFWFTVTMAVAADPTTLLV